MIFYWLILRGEIQSNASLQKAKEDTTEQLFHKAEFKTLFQEVHVIFTD